MKSQRKRIPVVFTSHSTCAHVDTFFYGDEIFWSWFWIPKDGECFFLYNVFIIVKFPVIKEGLIYWEKNKNKNKKTTMRCSSRCSREFVCSLVCAVIAVFTLHVYASSLGWSTYPKNANVSQFHRSHNAKQIFSLLEHLRHPCRDHVVYWHVSLQFTWVSTAPSSAVWHDLLLCLSRPYGAPHWSGPHSTKPSESTVQLWVSHFHRTDR